MNSTEERRKTRYGIFQLTHGDSGRYFGSDMSLILLSFPWWGFVDYVCMTSIAHDFNLPLIHLVIYVF